MPNAKLLAADPSGCGILSLQSPVPRQKESVGRHQGGTELERGCHDKAIGRIAMQSLQAGGKDRDAAVYGDLAHPCGPSIGSLRSIHNNAWVSSTITPAPSNHLQQSAPRYRR